MHQPPRAAGAAAVIGHKLYVAGGAPQTFNVSSFPVYNTLEIYDFDTGKWSFGAPMQVGRHHISGAAVDGKLYVVGGRGAKDHSLDIFESYDPKTDEWKTLPKIPLGVASPRVVAADGKVVVVGGEDQLNWEEGDGWVTPSAWAFDPKLNRWARLPDMRTERRGGGAGFADGRVYAIGGSYCPGPEARRTGRHSHGRIAVDRRRRPRLRKRLSRYSPGSRRGTSTRRLNSATRTPSWLSTRVWTLTTPRSSFDFEGLTSSTSVSQKSVSPWKTGLGWLSSSVARLAIALPETSETDMPRASE